MFKKLQKSVLNKDKLITNLRKKRVNKTPSKIVYPNRANLTFANIIVNMNSNQSLNSIDNWNNSYFNTELNNDSFTSRTKKNLNDFQNNSYLQDNNSKLLSLIIDGIISLKTYDLLNYSMKLIEIILFIRDNFDINDYIKINSEANKNLLMILYQVFFQNFNRKSVLYLLLKKDLKHGMKIFNKVHTIYIFYILSGITFIYYNLKIENKNFYNFLKKLIKTEKCNSLECSLCSQIENIENNNFDSINNFGNFKQKISVIKIFGKKDEKNNIINNNNINNNFKINKNFNKIFDLKQKNKYNFINISNDNISKRSKLNINSQIHNKDKMYNIPLKKSKLDKDSFSKATTERNNEKILDIKKYKNKNKKKLFYSQIVKANEKEKNQFYNDSLSSKEKSNSKNKNQNEENILENSFNIQNYKGKIEYNNKNINREEYSNLIDEIKIKLYKNNKLIKIYDNNIDNKNNHRLENKIDNNKKVIGLHKKEKSNKTQKVMLNYSTEIKKKSKNRIILENLIKKIDNNIDKKEYIKINNSLNNSSKIIKENIIAIEKEIKNFKEHNSNIKQQLLSLIQKNKAY